MTEPGGPRGRGKETSRDLRRVGDVLAAAVGRHGGETDLLVAVFSHWEEVVGGRLAAHVEPVAVEGRAVVVRADSGAWATQIRVLAEQIAARLTAATGQNVERLEVIGATAGGRDQRWRRQGKK